MTKSCCKRKRTDNSDTSEGTVQVTGQLVLGDGTLTDPAATFDLDTDTGLIRRGSGSVGNVSNGTLVSYFDANSGLHSVKRVRLAYTDGASGADSQLQLERSDGNYNLRQYIDSSNHFHIDNLSGSGIVYLEPATGGQVVVRSRLPTITNVDFIVQVGDGVSAYTNLLAVSESNITTGVPLIIPDGSAAAPSIRINSSQTGLYEDSASSLGITVNGVKTGNFDANALRMLLPIRGTGGGSLSEPSFSFTNDTNTGMYRPASEEVGFVCNGTQSGRFTESGLHIPASRALHVVQGAAVDRVLKCTNATTGASEWSHQTTITNITTGSLSIGDVDNLHAVSVTYYRMSNMLLASGYFEVDVDVAAPASFEFFAGFDLPVAASSHNGHVTIGTNGATGPMRGWIEGSGASFSVYCNYQRDSTGSLTDLPVYFSGIFSI